MKFAWVLSLLFSWSHAFAAEPLILFHPGHSHAKESSPAARSGTSYKWSLETSFSYLNYERVPSEVALEINDRVNGHMHDIIDEWVLSERITYKFNRDLEFGLKQGYRHLRQTNVTDPLVLGRRETSSGFNDLRLDATWRFKEQEGNGFPVDLFIFGEIKFPTGQTHERVEEEFDSFLIGADEQPGTGALDGTLGFALAREWASFENHASVSYTKKTQGTQRRQQGDVFSFSAGASRCVSPSDWSWVVQLGVDGEFLAEFKSRENGEIDRNHGGQFIIVSPRVSVSPLDRLLINVAVPLPVYQEYNGTHQRQDYGVRIGITVQF